jgi:hypothetical protein
MSSCSHASPLKYYSGLAFGSNMFLQCHTDPDFTMSMAQIHLKGKDKYKLDDNVIVYFGFPTLGAAVPLQPGDLLLFNALIPHCVLSRCRHADKIMCLSLYLKLAMVGMNNNKLHLNTKQTVLAKRYHAIVNNQLQPSHCQIQLFLIQEVLLFTIN